jgi:hypothetical protein
MPLRHEAASPFLSTLEPEPLLSARVSMVLTRSADSGPTRQLKSPTVRRWPWLPSVASI